MPVDRRSLVAELAADVVASRFARRRGLGVFVENLPSLDPNVFLQQLAGRAAAPRVALLGLGSAAKVKTPKGVRLTVDPTEANVWRNERDARATPTVVLVLGPAPKVNSLRTTLDPIGPADLRSAVVASAIALLENPERKAFWRSLGKTSAVALDSLLALLATLKEVSTESALLDLEPKSVHLLGLLQHPSLLASSGDSKALAALKKNLDLVDRLRDLSARDRRTLAAKDPEGTNQAVSAILHFARTKAFADLKELTFDDVAEALRPAKKEEKKGGKDQPAKSTMEGDTVALGFLLDDTPGLATAAKRFAHEVAPGDEGEIETEDISIGRRTVTPRVRTGTQQAVGAILSGLCDQETWGGVISAEKAADVVAALRLASGADADLLPFKPNEKDGVRELLARATKEGHVEKDALTAWDRYASLRQKLLQHAVALTDHPLMALGGSEQLRATAGELLETYNQALKGVLKAARSLKDVSPDASKRLRARAAAADVVFVRLEREVCALLTPTHPFHVWRWLTLHDLIKDNKEELSKVGAETLEPLIADPPAVAPHVVLSTFAVDDQADKTRSFVAAGNLGALPLFAEPGARQAIRFRSRALAQIAERLLRVMPHASLGLRVLLVDPPSVAGALEFLLELRSTIDGESRVPLQVTIARTRPVGEATDEEEEKLEELARELTEARGSLRVMQGVKSLKDVAGRMSNEPVHICAVFDPGDSNDIRLGVTAPPLLSPLVLPRAYHYDEFDDRLDVVTAGTAPAFENYQEIFCDLTDTPRTDFLGRRSGASRVSRDLEALATNSMWLTVIDQGVEPTLAIRGTNRIDSRVDSGRDLITFTAHTEMVEDLVADAIRQVGLKPNEETVKRAMRELLNLSGEALLWLARQKVSVDVADPRVAKGLLGVLAAVRWYLALHPEALVVSLDDPLSRRWILGAGSDDRHGDLLFLRPDNDGVAIEAIEVKTYEEDAGVVKATGGKVEGHAVTQIDQTLAVMKRIVLPRPDSMVDTARQSILRDQLYRAVAGRPYDQDKRKRFVNLIEALFSDGDPKMSGVVVKVKIESGRTSQAPSAPKYSKSPDGNHVGYAELIETETGGGGGPTARAKTAGGKGGQGTAEAPQASVRDGKPEYAVDAPKRPASMQSAVAAGGVKVLIGQAADGSDVVWEPGRQPNPLNNFGVLITGDPGAGKTQMLRAIISDVTRAGLPVCVFDFKNDYSDRNFADPLGFRVHDVNKRGLPFNPLALLGDAEGNAQPIRLIHEVVGIMKRIFNLGEQQEARLRQGIQTAFEAVGIDVKTWGKVTDMPTSPSFNDVIGILQHDDKNSALLNRLSPLFDLDLFPPSDSDTLSFEQMLKERIVLDLHALPNDQLKAALAEFMIVRIHSYMLKGDQPRELRRLLVLDEAWRVAQSERLQELAREGRAFGVGIAIGTQFPGDLPDTLGGSLATQLLLQNSDAAHRKVVARTLSGAAAGPEAQRLIKQIDKLQKHEGFFRNQHYAPYVLVQTLPHYKRGGATKAK